MLFGIPPQIIVKMESGPEVLASRALEASVPILLTWN